MNNNVILPFIIVVVLVAFIAIIRSRRNKTISYDERQLLARNTAYKYSFFFLMLYCLVCGMLVLFEIKWADAALQMLLGVVLSFVLFIALCMIKDAYFSDSPKRNLYSVLFFFWFGLMYFIHLMMSLSRGEVLFDNGELKMLALYLVASVCFTALGVLSAVKLIMEKRGAEKQ